MKKNMTSPFISILLSLAVFSGPVFAASKKAPPKKLPRKTVQTNKKKTVGELLKQADRGAGMSTTAVKKNTSLPQTRSLFERQAPPVNLYKVKPPNSSQFFEDADSDKAKLERITDQQIRELYKLTQKFAKSPQRGELWLRLAELYVEKAGIIEFRKQADYEAKLGAYLDKKTRVKPVLDLRDAKDYNKKAIQLYEWFVRDFPRDEKMDQALFFLGYNNYEIGDLKRGTYYYERLTREYPRSPYVTEGNFALAEYYFENENWQKALTSYQQVTKFKRHRLYSFSMYKSAWCEFRLGDTQQALRLMESLIRFGKQQQAQATLEGRKNISKARLEKEGLRDIVLFYSEAGRSESAIEYFQQLAGNDANGYIEKLAYLYGEKGNFPAAKQLFKYMIEQNSNAPKAFDYQHEIVKLYFNAKKSREFREEIFYWVKNFNEGSEWYNANSKDQEMVVNAVKLMETTLRNYVLQQHQSAQNSRAPYSQSLAFEGYKLYLAEFSKSEMIGDMHFYFGELLYDMKKYDEAGAQYRWVVENSPKSKFFTKAAENVVISYEKGLPTDKEMAERLGKSVEPVPLDPRVERFIQVGTWYLSKVPNNEKSVEIKFRIGRLYYQHNQFDQATPYFKDIVTKHPKTKFAEYSANLLLDTYNIRKDYAGMEKAGAEILAVPGFASSQAGADVKEVLEKASFKKAQDLEIAKDYANAGAQFEAFAKQNPKSELAITALFNAAINFERAGIPDRAMLAHAQVLKSTDPKAKEMQRKSKRIVAKLYQDAGKLEEAANAYRLAAADPESKALVPNLYYNAAALYEALGQNRQAIQNYEAYFESNKKRDRFEVYYTVATLYRKQDAKSKAIQNYKEYVNSGVGTQERNVESANWVYVLSQEIGRRSDAEDWKKKTARLQRNYAPNKKGVGATYAAKIAFDDALTVYREFRAIRIPQNPKAQQEAAKKKIDMITRLNSELAEVIKYDSPDEIIGSLSVLGQANQHMGAALMEAPLPAGLTADQAKQVRDSIAKIAEPFFAKAKESLKAAVARGSELDVYNKYYQEARDVLRKLEPSAVYEGAEVSSDFKQGQWVGL